jgi:dihydrofolate reductase
VPVFTSVFLLFAGGIMAKVVGGMVMSLDGFVNDRNGSVARLYPDMEAMRETEALQEAMKNTGAVLMGRHSYDMADGDYTGYEFQVPIFVVTHHVPEQVAKGENENLRFTFITNGLESAVQQAKAAAGENKVVTVVGGPSTLQQLMKAGLLDELRVDIAPVLLGEGLRLFEHLAAQQIKLEKIKVTDSSFTTAFHFRIVK